MEWLVNFSTWVETNSGQIQIGIALGAIWLAWKAYRKVLEQIEISNRQTEISIAQMDKLNKERMFDLKLRLNVKIGGQVKELLALQDICNALNIKIRTLPYTAEKRKCSNLEGIENLESKYKGVIAAGLGFAVENMKENSRYLKNIKTMDDISFMEDVLNKLEEKQMQYDSVLYEIKNIDNAVSKILVVINTDDIKESVNKLNNLS